MRPLRILCDRNATQILGLASAETAVPWVDGLERPVPTAPWVRGARSAPLHVCATCTARVIEQAVRVNVSTTTPTDIGVAMIVVLVQAATPADSAPS